MQHYPRRVSLAAFASIMSAGIASILSGCALQTTANAPTAAGMAIQGTVHGGQQPVSKSRIYLFAASTAGYGSPSISLMRTGTGSDSIGTYVETGSDGSFSISNDYTCVADSQVYLLALGGNPGLMPASTNNSALALMETLGTCPASGSFAASIPSLVINEASTVAAVYSLSGYMTGATAVSSNAAAANNPNSAHANTGLVNAFATSGGLVNIVSGAAPPVTPAGNGTIPVATINTLANIIASCVNSDGSVSGPSAATPCYTLFNNAVEGTTVPTDTVGALLNVAHHPAANVSGLFGLQAASPAFQPSLGSQPSDFTVQVSYTGGGLTYQNGQSSAHNLAIDPSGNVWTTNTYANPSGSATSVGSVSEFSPLGVPLSGTGFTSSDLSQPDSVAVDPAGNVLVTNLNGGVAVFTPSGGQGTALTTAASTDAALDAQGNVWVGAVNASSGLYKFTNGVAANGSPFTGNGLAPLSFLAIQHGGAVWVPDSNGFMSVFNNDGSAFSGSPFGLPGASVPFGVAIDHSGDVWTTDGSNGLVFKQTSSGAQAANSPFHPPNSGTGGGGAVAIDGGGNAWFVTGVPSMVELATNGTALSGPVGFAQLGTSRFDSIAIDGSGNVWTKVEVRATQGGAPASSTLLELVGAATPVVTPLSVAVRDDTLGTRP